MLTKKQAADVIFTPLYDLLEGINSGEVNEVNGIVSVHCDALPYKDTWASASLYLHIWCVAFQRIAQKAKMPVKTQSLLELTQVLQQEELELEESLLLSAKGELDSLKSLWCKLPGRIINQGLKTLHANQFKHLTE